MTPSRFNKRGLVSAALVFFLILGGSISCGQQSSTAPTTSASPAPQSLPTVTMTIGSKPFVLQKALNESERETGLMHVDAMPADRGMIFAFAQEQPLSFWMKNTHIPLDLIYLDHNGQVVAIQQGRPFDLTDLPSGKPAKYVIELNLGGAASAGLKVGDVVSVPPEVTATDR
jgi:uncharacterized protein